MPTYDYECERCGTFEIWQRISEPPLTTCRQCGGPIRRLLAPAGFILKGAGFYVNDYPSESRRKAVEAEEKASPAAASPSKGSDSPKGAESSAS